MHNKIISDITFLIFEFWISECHLHILIRRFIALTIMFFCVGDITRSMGKVDSYYFHHMHFFWSMSYVLHCSLVYLYTINYIFMLFLRVFQSFCMINKCTVTSPVETFPSLTFTGYFKSNLSFGSVLRWIVPSLFSVLLCSPFPCPIGSVCLPPSLGLFHLISSSRCALSWITTVISSC